MRAHTSFLFRTCWLLVALAAQAVSAPTGEEDSPDARAAQTLLDRFRTERRVAEEQSRFLAERRVQVGKAHFQAGDYRAAHRQFLQALQLQPDHAEARAWAAKARALLGLREGHARPALPDLLAQRRVAIQCRKAELVHLLHRGKALCEQERYPQAIQNLERAASLARTFAPLLDVADLAEEADRLLDRCHQAIEARRAQDAAERQRRARELAEQAAERRRHAVQGRHQELLGRARALFAQRRFAHARKLCERVLADDPAHGAAEALRQAIVEAARQADVATALRHRAAQVAHHWDRVAAQCQPQPELVSLSPERLDALRRRVAPGALGERREAPPAWETRIRQALAKDVSFDFVETPLQDVLSFLSSLAEVTIILDPQAVKDAAPSITLRVNHMRLERALSWVCKLVGLQYGLRDEAIYLSNRFHQAPELRMYDVSDITIHIQNFKGRQMALASDGGYRSTGSSGGQSGGEGIGEKFFKDPDEEKEEERFTGEQLVEFIRRTIAPGTWAEDGGAEERPGRIGVW